MWIPYFLVLKIDSRGKAFQTPFLILSFLFLSFVYIRYGLFFLFSIIIISVVCLFILATPLSNFIIRNEISRELAIYLHGDLKQFGNIVLWQICSVLLIILFLLYVEHSCFVNSLEYLNNLECSENLRHNSREYDQIFNKNYEKLWFKRPSVKLYCTLQKLNPFLKINGLILQIYSLIFLFIFLIILSLKKLKE